MPVESAIVCALWIAHTWVFRQFEYSPRLVITSPVMRCGKSTLLAVLAATTARSKKADSITAASIFRVVNARQPTLLMDEADTYLIRNEAMRGVLNSGYERSGQVTRTEGGYVVDYSTFSPVAIAAIGSVPATIQDRSLEISLRRKVGMKMPHVRDSREVFECVRRRFADWSAECADLSILHDIPAGLDDRQVDIAEALLAIADAAKGDWAAGTSFGARKPVRQSAAL